MSRPEHLHCINTAEGISRINQEQAYYDENPDRYEAEYQRHQEELIMEEQREIDEYNRQINKQYE